MRPEPGGRAVGALTLLLASVALASLAACGGGGDSAPPAPVPPPPAGPTDAQRSAAATSTANNAANACAPIRPFYWEIGDRSARLAAGSVDNAGGVAATPAYTATTPLSVASASKWLYSAYVAQKRNGVLSDSDIQFLSFRSGYTNFSFCLPGHSIDACLAYQTNGVYTAATEGFYFYDGGHMEQHASQSMGLGALFNAGLAAEIRTQLGSDVNLSYTQPQLAGGAASTADDYARFLRKLLGGQLQLGALLGTHAVCTNPATCPTARGTPVPTTESWHYSLGHWVEDDPVVGDGAFSSAGGLGFYPWIDSSKRWYGVLARQVASAGEGYESTVCGRLIRKAWVTGVAL